MSSASFFQTRTKPQPVEQQRRLELPALTSDDPDISAFYAQLSEKERLAHAIAVVKLGTSYDVVRTHGYLKWLRNKTKA